MRLIHYFLEQTPVYRLWQAPFVADKLAPILRHNDLRGVRRVLDVGCGPGTNAPIFAQADYLGVDINPRYIESARRKYNRRFEVADVATQNGNSEEKFDFILVNSFLHHMGDTDVHNILTRLVTELTSDGHLHILELVSPGDRSLAQLLANWDRGKYPRSLESWTNVFERHLDVAVLKPYSVGLFSTTLWSMVYCKGRAKP
jgi:trans-aconitate methyltransferase